MTLPTADALLTRPFEVYFDQLGLREYQFLGSHDTLDQVRAIEVKEGNAYGVTLRCDDNSTGAHLLCTITNEFQGVVPDWLHWVDEDSMDIQSTRCHPVQIQDRTVSWTETDADEDLHDSHWGNAWAQYLFDQNQDPTYLILDADGARIKVSPNGCALDEAGEEIESEVLFDWDQISEEARERADAESEAAIQRSSPKAARAALQAWINRQLGPLAGGAPLAYRET